MPQHRVVRRYSSHPPALHRRTQLSQGVSLSIVAIIAFLVGVVWQIFIPSLSGQLPTPAQSMSAQVTRSEPIASEPPPLKTLEFSTQPKTPPQPVQHDAAIASSRPISRPSQNPLTATTSTTSAASTGSTGSTASTTFSLDQSSTTNTVEPGNDAIASTASSPAPELTPEAQAKPESQSNPLSNLLSSTSLPDAIQSVLAPGTPTPAPKPKDEIVSFNVPNTYQGKVVHQVAVAPTDKVIALTFDDGPWPESTPKILDILKQHQIKATFFWIGLHLENYPKIGKQVVADNHVIGNHTWHHRYHDMSREEAAEEIEHTAKLMQKLAGVKTDLFRPPGGRLKNGLAEYAENSSDTVVLWSVMPSDVDPTVSAETITERVLKTAHPGGIVLLHDGGGNRRHTVKALPKIIEGLEKKGYQFVTVPELMEHPTTTSTVAAQPPFNPAG